MEAIRVLRNVLKATAWKEEILKVTEGKKLKAMPITGPPGASITGASGRNLKAP